MTLNDLMEKIMELQKQGLGNLPVVYYASIIPDSVYRQEVNDIFRPPGPVYVDSDRGVILITGSDGYWEEEEV